MKYMLVSCFWTVAESWGVTRTFQGAVCQTYSWGGPKPGVDEDPAVLTDAEVVEKPAKEETVIENATPDYAAGLVSTQVGR